MTSLSLGKESASIRASDRNPHRGAALAFLFTAEMWERFSYYGMRALLIFYMTKHFFYGDAQAGLLYGSYTALAYLTPVIGGWLADRYLGHVRAVLIGGVLLVAGHAGMAFEGAGGQDDPMLQAFFLSLALIIAGVGLLKANISALVGQMYTKDDPKRDGGFTIFYMGINLGAAVAPILCGYLAEPADASAPGAAWNWSAGFGVAGIGMALGLISLLIGQGRIRAAIAWAQAREEGADLAIAAGTRFSAHRGRATLFTLLGLPVTLAGLMYFVQTPAVTQSLLYALSLAALAYVVWTANRTMAPAERDRIYVALVLTVFSVVFWALFEQAGSSLNLFTERHSDQAILGVETRVTYFQSLNAIFIVFLGLPFAFLWTRLERARLNPPTAAKFALGLLQIGLGFLVLVAGFALTPPGQPVDGTWIVLLYLLHTTGELCLSPVGLSAVTRLSPVSFVGVMLGMWFLASAFANFVAGQIAALTAGGNLEAGEVMPNAQAVEVFGSVYLQAGLIAIICGGVLMLLVPLLRRLSHGVK